MSSVPSFLLDSPPAPPKLDLSGAQSPLFHLPPSSSASSSLYRSMSSSRKRARYESHEKQPLGAADSGVMSRMADDRSSPAALAYTDYCLAGGREAPRNPFDPYDPFDPNAATVSRAELDYRPNRYYQGSTYPSLVDSVESVGATVTHAESAGAVKKGRKRTRSDSLFSAKGDAAASGYGLEDAADDDDDDADDDESARRAGATGWRHTVINAVGKVWDFCWSGAFRGFYAGGGRGYEMSASSGAVCPPMELDGSSFGDVEKDSSLFPTPATDGAARRRDSVRPQPHLPGQFPDDDLQRSWVVVPSESDSGSREPLSASLLQQPQHQPAYMLPGSRLSTTAAPPRMGYRSGAAMSPRRRGRRFMTAAAVVTPRLGKRAAVIMPSSSPPLASAGRPMSPKKARDSPASTEAQRYAAQMRRIEREEDASLLRLNQQLQAMIREGREALGTRVEVDEMDEYE